MTSLSRGLAVLELLSREPGGFPLYEIADELDLPRSAVHRILANLVDDGYVAQEADGAPYKVTLKVVSIALRSLAVNNTVDQARPVLLKLAAESKELARLSLVDADGTRLVWVAKEQGARSGLRFDPDSGAEVRLSPSATGLAWLSQLSDERALQLVYRQSETLPACHGTIGFEPTSFLERLHEVRDNGYGLVVDTVELGSSAVAVPIADGHGGVLGTLSLAGPSIRLTPDRMRELVPALLAAAEELSPLGIRTYTGLAQ